MVAVSGRLGTTALAVLDSSGFWSSVAGGCIFPISSSDYVASFSWTSFPGASLLRMLTTAFRAQPREKDNLLPHAPDLTQARGSFLAYFCLSRSMKVCMGVFSRLLYLGSIFHGKVSKISPQNSLTKINTHITL